MLYHGLRLGYDVPSFLNETPATILDLLDCDAVYHGTAYLTQTHTVQGDDALEYD